MCMCFPSIAPIQCGKLASLSKLSAAYLHLSVVGLGMQSLCKMFHMACETR